MQSNEDLLNNFFKTNNIIYFALLGGLVFFLIIVLFLYSQGFIETDNDQTLYTAFLVISVVMTFNAFVTGNIIYKKKIKEQAELNNITEKLMKYREAFLIRFTLLEGATFFLLIVFLVTANFLFIALAGFVLAYFIYLKPNRSKVLEEMNLDGNVVRALE